MSHVPSPQTGPVAGQSAAHVALVSPALQTPLPHVLVVPPQSAVQLPISDDAHTESPQTAAPVAASGVGPSSPPDGLPAPHAQPATITHRNASVVVLIEAHRTERQYEINDKLCNARR